MKEILNKVEVGLNPQKSFTKMDKDRDVKNRIRGQVMHLNPPVMKKAPEEIRNQKIEATKNIRKKNNRFIFFLMRKRLPIRTPPMDNVLGLKKMLLYQSKQVGVGTHTRLPPMGFRIFSASLTRLPPSSRSLGSHENEEKTILSLASHSGG